MIDTNSWCAASQLTENILQVVNEVARAVQKRPYLKLVVDPVLVTTSGHNLAAEAVGACIAKQ